jgi:hypothetical protein
MTSVDGSFWHKADLPRRLLFVRFRVQTGRHLLVVSFSASDPDAALVVSGFRAKITDRKCATG